MNWLYLLQQQRQSIFLKYQTALSYSLASFSSAHSTTETIHFSIFTRLHRPQTKLSRPITNSPKRISPQRSRGASTDLARAKNTTLRMRIEKIIAPYTLRQRTPRAVSIPVLHCVTSDMLSATAAVAAFVSTIFRAQRPDGSVLASSGKLR